MQLRAVLLPAGWRVPGTKVFGTAGDKANALRIANYAATAVEG